MLDRLTALDAVSGFPNDDSNFDFVIECVRCPRRDDGVTGPLMLVGDFMKTTGSAIFGSGESVSECVG